MGGAVGLFALIAVLAAPAVWARGPDYSGRPARLVLIKSDGLPPDLLAAVAVPERKEYLDRLPYADELRQAMEAYRRRTGREIILPNIRRYFFENGVFAENTYSETLTLSAVAWSVIETGQPSVVKGHGTFSRDTSYVRSHLDGFRDTMDAIKHQGGKTSALWNLDQVGVSLVMDAYNLERTWTSPHIYRRIGNRELLLEAGKRWLDNNQDGFGNIVRSHLSRLVTGIDYIEWAQEMAGLITARKILERDLTGEEQYDYISPLFTLMDHQQHIDPHPRNLIHWLVKLDLLVGEIFAAVERSDRRERTVVALVSDHGSEIDPGKVAFSFPLTKVFRTPLLGGHTVKTMLVESAWNALSTPIPGIDFPRVYESDYSPYGKSVDAKAGEDDYVTCFIDPFGNARATVNLRNNDLNRLHLILMKLKQNPDEGRFARLRELFRTTLAKARVWLEPDLALYRDYHAGSQDLARHLSAKTDNYSLDSVWRLTEEAKRDAPQIAALDRLLAIRFDCDGQAPCFDELFSGSFQIEDYIPKGYLGLANNIHQLSHYTLGLDDDLQWVETTVDAQGKRVPMDYFQILSNYQASNAPVNGLRNPFDFLATPIKPAQIMPALVQRGLAADFDRLRNVVWVKSTARHNPNKGGEALILQTMEGLVKYVPVTHLQQSEGNSFAFDLADDRDPLALLAGRGFEPPGGGDRLDWARAYHPRQAWLEATHKTEYSTAVCILLDILNDAVPEFVDSPDFQDYLIYFSSDEMKQRYLRGLKRKYASQEPDFVVWADLLWNFNSKARTSGGSHSGLRPMAARTTFLVWGGDDTRIDRGRVLSDVATTLDLAPTLLRAVGMLDDNNQVIREPLSVPERPFRQFPGRVLDIWRRAPLALHGQPKETPNTDAQ